MVSGKMVGDSKTVSGMMVGDGWTWLVERWLVIVMSTIPKRKYKRSDIEANYRNETKTF